MLSFACDAPGGKQQRRRRPAEVGSDGLDVADMPEGAEPYSLQAKIPTPSWDDLKSKGLVETGAPFLRW